MLIDRKYLPSKRFLAACGVAAVIIAITIFLNTIKPAPAPTLSTLAGASTTAPWVNTIDSDNDGLPDWQEVLYGTNPRKADTDGDGTNDGDEIALKRDPLKANTAPQGQEPNDKIAADVIAQNDTISSAINNTLSATEQMARNLMSNIFASQPTDSQMDQNTVDSIVTNTLANVPQKQFATSTKVSDLNLIPVASDSKSAAPQLIAYAKSFYTETEKLRQVIGQDVVAINTYNTDNDAMKEQDSLAAITKIYQTVINDFKSMPLPAIADSYGAAYHLAVINDLEQLIEIDNDIMKSTADGVSIYGDLLAYTNVINNLTKTLGILDNVLQITRH